MEKKDFEGMWKDYLARLRSGRPEYKFAQKDAIFDMEAIEREHTVWEPEHGEWVWCLECKEPIKFGDTHIVANSDNLEPLSKHLPILEYGGFKVGEHIIFYCLGKNGIRMSIDSFIFEKGRDVRVSLRSDNGVGVAVGLKEIEHLPPPEPDEYVIDSGLPSIIRIGGVDYSTFWQVTISLEGETGTLCSSVQINDDEIDRVIRALQKLKKKFKRNRDGD